MLIEQGVGDVANVPTRVGGARLGAGRKPLEGGRVTAAFVLRQDQVEMIEAHAAEANMSKSEWVRRLLDLYRR